MPWCLSPNKERKQNMKIAGRKIKGPNRVTLVLPREDDEDIVIIAQAISDIEEFEKYLDAPKAPVRIVKGGNEHDYSDKDYLEQLQQFNIKRIAWIVLKSLEPSNIEWEKVKMDNPSTWLGYQDEMKEAGFSAIEINRICNLAMEANALDESKLEAARQVFLRGQAVVEKSTSGPSTPQQNS